MQSRNICVKCSADGELLPKRKVESCLRYMFRTRCSRSSGIPFNEVQVFICLRMIRDFFVLRDNLGRKKWI